MLYSYKGIDKDYKYKRGTVESDSHVEAMNKIKENEGIIVIMNLKRTSNIPVISNIRNAFNNRIQNVENRINERTNQIIQRDKKKYSSLVDTEDLSEKSPIIRGIKNLTNRFSNKEESEDNSESLAEKSPILKGITNFASSVISRNKKIIVDEDMYDNLQEMFKHGNTSVQQNASVQPNYNAEHSQIELSQNKVKKTERKISKDKSEGKKINWSLIESDDSPEVKENMKIKIKSKEIVMFTRRLQIMLSSGVPLLTSLISLRNTSSEKLEMVLSKVVEDIQVGRSFSEALAKFPSQFDTTYIALVSIGETSGSLQQSLKDIIRVKEQSDKIDRKVRVASVYPIAIGIVLIVFLIGANFLFIPQFSAQFEAQGTELPQFTQLVFGISEYFPWIMGAVALMIMTFVILDRKIPEFHYLWRRNWDKFKLKAPVIKNVSNASYMYSFSSNIALMLDNGIRLSDTLALTGKTINNIFLKNDIEDVSNLMLHGLTFSESLEQQENFDVILINIASTGEQSGKMVFSLEQVAEYYEQELTRQIDSLLELVQPVSILLIGLTVAPIIIAAYLPILDMSSGAGLF